MTTAVQKFIVLNKIGLHARPAAKFVKFASSLKQNEVWIENITRQTNRVNAKSIIMVLSTSIQQNDEIRITIEGPNSMAAMQEFADMFKARFGEEE